MELNQAASCSTSPSALSSAPRKAAPVLSRAMSTVQFSILGASAERPAVTQETAILTRDFSLSDLCNVLLGLSTFQSSLEKELSFTTIFTKDTDFSLYTPSQVASSNTLGNDSAGKMYSSGSLGTVLQLSGDSERIHAEAVDQVSPFLRTLNVRFTQHNESALELLASLSLRVLRSANKVVNLEPYRLGHDKYILYVDNCEAGVIYGNIAAGFK
ncbi:Coatomer beta subunit [Giardia duodenalis]|nr:Coatomer beta subunit [Giardia intestinalis]